MDERLFYKLLDIMNEEEYDDEINYSYCISASEEEAKAYFIDLLQGSKKFGTKQYSNSYNVCGTLDGHYVDLAIETDMDGTMINLLYYK